MPALTDTDTAARLAPGRMMLVASTSYDVEATAADIPVEIRGSAIFHSRVAFAKAKEVAKLVSDLHATGVSEDDIRLDGVKADQTSGRSSSATYMLSIRCHSVAMLPGILSVIASQPNARLGQILWRYPEEHAAAAAAVETCLRRIRARAEQLAKGLGLQLAGVASVREAMSGAERQRALLAVPGDAMPRLGGAQQIDLGVDASHTKCIMHNVNVEYYVEPASADYAASHIAL
jgi:uncharacterized protein YggE